VQSGAPGLLAGSGKEFDALTAAASHNRALSKSLSQRPELPNKRTYLAAAVRLRATSRHFLELYPCYSEQLRTERVFLEVPDEHAVCGENAIEWPMLRGEERIACQSDRTRLTRAPARQRSNLRPGRLLRCLIRAPDRAGPPAGHFSLSAAACSHKSTDQSVETMVARTAPG
jgi:hypothetical protein